MVNIQGDISRQNLERHGIYFANEIYQSPHDDIEIVGSSSTVLPDHVDSVREALLDFSELIPSDRKGNFENEFNDLKYKDFAPQWHLRPPPSAYFQPSTYELRFPSEKLRKADRDIQKFQTVAETARKLESEGESGWKHFWRTNVFRVFYEECSTRTDYDIFFDQWSLQEDTMWNGFPQWEIPAPHLTRRTYPKPDLTFAFPISKSTSKRPKGFERDQFTQLFSLKTLAELRKHGLISTPTTGLQKWTESRRDISLTTSDLSCFPWAVVEIKKRVEKSDSRIERCYCQAANGAAAALTIRERFLERCYGYGADASIDIPPVISFTCIGPIVRVWLTFQSSDPAEGRIKRMVCIWSTSLELTWGVMTLQIIVQRMRVWASRALKPRILAWVHQASVDPIVQSSHRIGLLQTY